MWITMDEQKFCGSTKLWLSAGVDLAVCVSSCIAKVLVENCLEN